MDAGRIQYLASWIPRDSDYWAYNISHGAGDVSLQRETVNRYLAAYGDLAFGYHFVRALIDGGIPLPPDVDERELADCYWFERRGEISPGVVEALSIRHPRMRFIENSLQALLLTGEDFPGISRRTGIGEKTVRVYEKLFFNIRDRRDESLFIANVVYPEHRLVETMEGYMRNVDPGMFLKRAGYNNGPDDAAYFIGLEVPEMNNIHDSREMANRLEASIMANGYYLARNGMLNQRSSHGVAAAKSLIVAAKQGGEDTGDQDFAGASSIGEALMDDLVEIKGGEMRSRIESQQDDAMKSLEENTESGSGATREKNTTDRENFSDEE